MWIWDNLLLFCIQWLGMAAGILLVAGRMIHSFQLEECQFQGCSKTICSQARHTILPCLLLGAVYAAVYIAWFLTMAPVKGNFALHVCAAFVAGLLYALAGFLIRQQGMKQKERKSFAPMTRVKWLYGALAFLLVLIPAIIYGIQQLIYGGALWFLCLLAGIVMACFLPLLVALAGAVAGQIERLFFHPNIRKAE